MEVEDGGGRGAALLAALLDRKRQALLRQLSGLSVAELAYNECKEYNAFPTQTDGAQWVARRAGEICVQVK